MRLPANAGFGLPTSSEPRVIIPSTPAIRFSGFTSDKQLQMRSPRENNRVIRQVGTPGSEATRTITCDVTSSVVDDAEKAFPPIPQVSTAKLQVMGRFRGSGNHAPDARRPLPDSR